MEEMQMFDTWGMYGILASKGLLNPNASEELEILLVLLTTEVRTQVLNPIIQIVPPDISLDGLVAIALGINYPAETCLLALQRITEVSIVPIRIRALRDLAVASAHECVRAEAQILCDQYTQ